MFVKLCHNSKIPVKGDWQLTDEPADFLRDGFNVGLTLKNMTVVDFDDKPSAREFYRKHSGVISTIVETRRGAHFYFGTPTRARKFYAGDIKSGENSYVVCPPSVVNEFRYRFVQNGILQPFPEHEFPETKNGVITRDPVKNVDAYLAKIQSIQGQNGSAGLVRAAAVCRDSGDSEAEALLRLMQWNRSNVVNPPWPERDLARAVTRVFKKS
jgi:hypothetical protein